MVTRSEFVAQRSCCLKGVFPLLYYRLWRSPSDPS